MQEPVRGELWFARSELVRGSELLCPFPRNFWRTCSPNFTFAANPVRGGLVRGERSSEVDVISSRERIFWRTVRQFAADCGRTRANPGELRRTPANVRRTPANVRRSSAECRCWRIDGEFARSSREFARVRPSSREFAANDSSPGILPECSNYQLPNLE